MHKCLNKFEFLPDTTFDYGPLRKKYKNSQELVHEVQMAGSRTSVLELVLEPLRLRTAPVKKFKNVRNSSRTSSRISSRSTYGRF